MEIKCTEQYEPNMVYSIVYCGVVSCARMQRFDGPFDLQLDVIHINHMQVFFYHNGTSMFV